jgi:hypothetical protein
MRSASSISGGSPTGSNSSFSPAAGKSSGCGPDGSNLTQLSVGEDPNAVWDFATNEFGLYGSNGIKAYRFIDTGNGLLTKFNWGIQAPGAAPTFTFAAGALTLTQGRQYAFSVGVEMDGRARHHAGARRTAFAFDWHHRAAAE